MSNLYILVHKHGKNRVYAESLDKALGKLKTLVCLVPGDIVANWPFELPVKPIRYRLTGENTWVEVSE